MLEIVGYIPFTWANAVPDRATFIPRCHHSSGKVISPPQRARPKNQSMQHSLFAAYLHLVYVPALVDGMMYFADKVHQVSKRDAFTIKVANLKGKDSWHGLRIFIPNLTTVFAQMVTTLA